MYKRTQIKLICPICNVEYNKDKSEHIRNTKLNRISYCSLSCAGRAENNNSRLATYPKFDLSPYRGNRADEYTLFRRYLKSAKNRKNKIQNIDITLEDLKEVWEKQNGICPYSKINLLLAPTTFTIKFTENPFFYASLDRIDSSKGYTKDNIEFVSMGINFLKNHYSKEQVISFIQELVHNFKSRAF